MSEDVAARRRLWVIRLPVEPVLFEKGHAAELPPFQRAADRRRRRNPIRCRSRDRPGGTATRRLSRPARAPGRRRVRSNTRVDRPSGAAHDGDRRRRRASSRTTPAALQPGQRIRARDATDLDADDQRARRQARVDRRRTWRRRLLHALFPVGARISIRRGDRVVRRQHAARSALPRATPRTSGDRTGPASAGGLSADRGSPRPTPAATTCRFARPASRSSGC